MAARRKYVKRAATFVVAVQLDLQTAGFTYRKWGGKQTCKRGDWIVDNAGDVYTVDRKVFARTYREASPGLYRKFAPVWAEVANQGGSIRTKEGVTNYKAGDYLVFNDKQRKDGWAVKAPSFKAMYKPAD